MFLQLKPSQEAQANGSDPPEDIVLDDEGVGGAIRWPFSWGEKRDFVWVWLKIMVPMTHISMIMFSRTTIHFGG